MLRFQKMLPNPKLREYVHYYFLVEPSPELALDNNQALKNHPQGTFDVMFALRGGLELENHKGAGIELGNIFLIAQQEGYFKIRFRPDSYIIGIVFYPEAFNKLFNFPVSELSNSGRCVDDELSETYHDLYHRLHHLKSDFEIPTLLNQFIEKELSRVDFSFTRFDALIRSIRLEHGEQSIKMLANQANMSERTLQRKVKNAIGVGPKSFSNIMRFKMVLETIVKYPEVDWQDILYLSGYYDQAHFIKEFKKYTGRTPSAFIKTEQLDLSTLFLNKEK